MSGTAQTYALAASWPLPQAADLSAAYEQGYAAAFPGCDPTRPNSFMAVQARIHGMVGFNLYLYQRSLADELMADTARAFLQRHANQWGVPQLPPTPAIGLVVFSGPADLPLPQGIEIVDQLGNQYLTTAAGSIGAGLSATVQVQAELPGAAGNQAAGAQLTIVSPVIGLQNQQVTVDAGGLAGGADAEPVAAWRARILLRIRKRGQSGNDGDYVEWAESAGAAPSPSVIDGWVGPGSVGVVFALPNPGGDRLAPTPAQVAAMQAALNLVRPITAQVVAIAAVQLAVPLTVALAADTVVGRALAAAAAQAFIAAVPIGGLLDHSQLADAMLQACGCGVEIVQPPGNLQPGPTQMLIIGPVNFVAYT